MKVVILTIILALIPSAGRGPSAQAFTRDRSFFIEEKILLKNLPKNANDLHIWIPYPVSDNNQSIADFKLEPSLNATLIEDEEYGNKILYIGDRRVSVKPNIEITVSFKVDRKELELPNDIQSAPRPLSRFLKADRSVPVDESMRELAERITKGKGDDLAKVRAIYDYIIDELTYSKDDPKVCGVGDSRLTLKHKKGICSDYHSLFISLVRSLGIPAKFEIGFPVPRDKAEGEIKGYHCWAKFYMKDKGWIPVDISEADKHSERRDYFFGHIDENRLHLTTGRDISLKYAKNPGPLNFFVYPYAELNGSRVDDLDIRVSFKDLKGGV